MMKSPDISPNRPVRARASWLHDEAGRRLVARTQCLQQAPERWMDWCPSMGGMATHQALSRLWPNAHRLVVESSAVNLPPIQAILKQPLWKRWLPGAVSIEFTAYDSVNCNSRTQVDVLCANLPFSESAFTIQRLTHWLDCTRAGGSLFFCALGPDTAIELKTLYEQAQWGVAKGDSPDLHDLGDQLLASGWSDPVVDSERLQLTYSHVDDLLRDLRAFGRNLHPQRFAGLRGRAWLTELRERLSQQPLVLTIELLFAHAVKPYQTQGQSPAGQGAQVTHVAVEQLRANLRASKSKSNPGQR